MSDFDVTPPEEVLDNSIPASDEPAVEEPEADQPHETEEPNLPPEDPSPDDPAPSGWSDEVPSADPEDPIAAAEARLLARASKRIASRESAEKPPPVEKPVHKQRDVAPEHHKGPRVYEDGVSWRSQRLAKTKALEQEHSKPSQDETFRPQLGADAKSLATRSRRRKSIDEGDIIPDAFERAHHEARVAQITRERIEEEIQKKQRELAREPEERLRQTQQIETTEEMLQRFKDAEDKKQKRIAAQKKAKEDAELAELQSKPSVHTSNVHIEDSHLPVYERLAKKEAARQENLRRAREASKAEEQKRDLLGHPQLSLATGLGDAVPRPPSGRRVQEKMLAQRSKQLAEVKAMAIEAAARDGHAPTKADPSVMLLHKEAMVSLERARARRLQAVKDKISAANASKLGAKTYSYLRSRWTADIHAACVSVDPDSLEMFEREQIDAVLTTLHMLPAKIEPTTKAREIAAEERQHWLDNVWSLLEGESGGMATLASLESFLMAVMDARLPQQTTKQDDADDTRSESSRWTAATSDVQRIINGFARYIHTLPPPPSQSKTSNTPQYTFSPEISEGSRKRDAAATAKLMDEQWKVTGKPAQRHEILYLREQQTRARIERERKKAAEKESKEVLTFKPQIHLSKKGRRPATAPATKPHERLFRTGLAKAAPILSSEERILEEKCTFQPNRSVSSLVRPRTAEAPPPRPSGLEQHIARMKRAAAEKQDLQKRRAELGRPRNLAAIAAVGPPSMLTRSGPRGPGSRPKGVPVQRRLLFFLDLRLGEGLPSVRVPVWDIDTASEVVYRVALEHNLDKRIQKRLHAVVEQRINFYTEHEAPQAEVEEKEEPEEPEAEEHPLEDQSLRPTIAGEAIEGKQLIGSHGYGIDDVRMQWIRMRPDGTEVVVEGADGTVMFLTDEDVGCQLVFKVQPPGEAAPEMSELSDVVDPGPPTVLSLAIDGEAEVGRVLVAQVMYSGGEEGPHQLIWYRKVDQGDESVVAEGELYRVTEEDIGAILSLECVPFRSDGVAGEAVRVGMAGSVKVGEV